MELKDFQDAVFVVDNIAFESIQWNWKRKLDGSTPWNPLLGIHSMELKVDQGEPQKVPISPGNPFNGIERGGVGG